MRGKSSLKNRNRKELQLTMAEKWIPTPDSGEMHEAQSV
jgi:hypothetical protein